MLEVLIALGVGIAVLSSMVVVVFVSLSGAQFAKNQNLATQYGQQGMELVRKERDTKGWDTFFTSYPNGTYCLSADGVFTKLIGASCPKNVGIFIRSVEFSWDGERATVTTTVSWTDAKGKHQSKLISYFTKWSSSP